MTSKKKVYWFISYLASGSNIHGNCVSNVSPARWSFDLQQDKSITDGPYVIMYAEQISEAEFKRQEGWW